MTRTRADWQQRHHTKRRDYAPNVEWIVGQFKHGESTRKDSYKLDIEQAFALRDYADDQGVHLSDVLVDALQLGPVSTDEARSREVIAKQIRAAEDRLKAAKAAERDAAINASDSELRWSRMRRRERATHAWAALVKQRLPDQELQRLVRLEQRNREHVSVHVDVDEIPVDLGTPIFTEDADVHAMREPILIGQRIPVSLHEAMRAEVRKARKTGSDVRLADVVRARVRRFLLLHGRDPVVRAATIQLRNLRMASAKSRARRREYLRLAKAFRIRRRRLRERLDHLFGLRHVASRVPTRGELTAFEEHERDPSALDVDAEMDRRDMEARQRLAVSQALRRRPAAA